MKVNAYVVTQHLAEYHPKLIANNANIQLTNCEVLETAFLKPRAQTIYLVSEPSEMRVLPLDEPCTVLCCFPEYEMYDYPEFMGVKSVYNFIFLNTYVNVREMYGKMRVLLEQFQRLAEFSSDLFRALSEHANLQSLTDIIFEYIENSIYIIDTGFQLLAARECAHCSSPHLKEIDGKYYLADEEMRNVNYMHNHETMKTVRKPVLVENEHIGNRRILTMIDYDRDIGHFVVVEDEKPFDSMDYEYINEFRQALKMYFSKDSFAKNVKGFHYEYFLRDLLSQHYVVSAGHEHRVKYIDKVFKRNIFCIVVETGKTLGGVHISNVRNYFEGVLPNVVTVVYEHQIVIIASGYHDYRMQACHIQELQEYVEGNGLYCGMSNAFDNILNLFPYYKQAIRAIELGTMKQDDPGLFVYEQYHMSHLTSVFCGVEDPEVYCHPYMKILMEYDEANDTELAKTLYYALVCGNTNETAAALYVHRNTILYRMNLISDLLAADFKDLAIRRHLVLSYELLHGGLVEEKQRLDV